MDTTLQDEDKAAAQMGVGEGPRVDTEEVCVNLFVDSPRLAHLIFIHFTPCCF